MYVELLFCLVDTIASLTLMDKMVCVQMSPVAKGLVGQVLMDVDADDLLNASYTRSRGYSTWAPVTNSVLAGTVFAIWAGKP